MSKLLHLKSREALGLEWVRRWARHRITQIKRGRKYRAHEAKFKEEELALLTTLLELERTASAILKERDARDG